MNFDQLINQFIVGLSSGLISGLILIIAFGELATGFMFIIYALTVFMIGLIYILFVKEKHKFSFSENLVVLFAWLFIIIALIGTGVYLLT